VIAFDLRCGAGHVFEAWFGSGASYETQAAEGQVSCPVCGDSDVAKAVMAPNIAAKGNRAQPAAAAAAIKALAEAQGRMLRDSTWVGDDFARRARAMHEDGEPKATIHGRATVAQARSLAEDGVPVAPLPLPVVPPRELN